MTRGDPTPGPTRMQCPDCAMDVPPAGGITDLWVAEHQAKHLEWEVAHGVGDIPANGERMNAWRDYAGELEKRVRALKEQINTRDDVITQLEADLWHANTELQHNDARGVS